MVTSWQLTNAKRTGAIIVRRRRGERAADAAGVPCFVDEAVPVFARGPQARCEEAARPVGGRAHLHIAARDDAREGFVAGDLHHQPVRAYAGIGLAARPQDHAVRRGIAGGHALRVEIASFGARAGWRVRAALTEGESCAKGRSLLQQRPARRLSAHRFHSAS